MREGWRAERLGDICEVIAGQSPKGHFYNDTGDGLPFYQGKKDFGEKYIKPPRCWTTHVTKQAYRGDILMSVRAPVGPINFATEKICIGRGLAAIRAKEKVDHDFLFYALLSKQSEITGNEGAVFASVSKKHIEDISIPLPPLAEQKRIVAILDEAFEGMDRATANTEKNLANAQELFKSYLNSILFQRAEDWTERSLGETCKIISKLVNPKDSKHIDSPHIGAGNMISKNGELVDVKTAREERLKSGKHVFDKGMVLYSKIRPYLMKVCRPNFSGLCSADVYPLSPKEDLLDRDYLFYLLLSEHFTNYAISGSARAGMPKVNRNHLFRYSTYFPDIAEQKQITSSIDKLSVKTGRLRFIYQEKLNALSELKQSILQRSFSGELTESIEVTTEIAFPKTIPGISPTDLHAGILSMAYQQHENNPKHENTFGHVKAEKIAHMVEAHAGINLERNPVKDAAGPNDFPRFQTVETRAKRAGFFIFKKDKGNRYTFKKYRGFDSHIEKTREKLGANCEAVERILKVMLPMGSQQAEIFATVYAAWNNLLIRGEEISDEAIVYEARENWHENKLKIPRENFFQAIKWMREKDIIPLGKGKIVDKTPS